MKKTYKIEVDCVNCANKMEDAAKKVDGVSDATINFFAQKLNMVFDENADVDSVMKSVVKACKKVESDCEIYI